MQFEAFEKLTSKLIPYSYDYFLIIYMKRLQMNWMSRCIWGLQRISWRFPKMLSILVITFLINLLSIFGDLWQISEIFWSLLVIFEIFGTSENLRKYSGDHRHSSINFKVFRLTFFVFFVFFGIPSGDLRKPIDFSGFLRTDFGNLACNLYSYACYTLHWCQSLCTGVTLHCS